MSTTVLLSTFHPFPSLTLLLPAETPISAVPTLLPSFLPSLVHADLAISLHSGVLPSPCTPLSALCDGPHSLLSLRLTPRLRGGKGGFGSQLRAAGGRMSSQKTNNNDSCRDLNGRRFSTIKEAKVLAEYIEGEPARKKAAAEERRAKLESLERKLGISANGDAKEKEKVADEPTGLKRRFDDTEYLEQSREIVDNVKNAVAAGMLKKKKKKTKLSPEHTEPTQSAVAVESVVAESVSQTEAETIVEKVVDSAATAPLAAAISVTAAIGA